MVQELILASASPRRKEILEQVGIKFTTIPSTKEEVTTKKDPEEVVKELALIKAQDVADQTGYEGVILGADTIVVHNNIILGKPKDREDAIGMLRNLQGDTHKVFTGVAIIKQGTIINFAVETKVVVAPMSQKEMEAYADTKEPMDKAGAYGIQGRFAVYIEEIQGDYYNVVGLPIGAIYKELKKFWLE